MAAEGVDVPALVARAREGDGAAWEQLYRRAYPRLLAYASRRLSGQDEAREAVSEAMARAVAGLHRFRGEGAGFDGWLYGILRHVVLDAQRARQRQVYDDVPEQVDDAPQPLDRVVQDEDAMRVRTAFARLSPKDQELLELRVVGELSSEHTAAVLGRRPGAVRMAQARALTKLRQMLEETDGVLG